MQGIADVLNRADPARSQRTRTLLGALALSVRNAAARRAQEKEKADEEAAKAQPRGMWLPPRIGVNPNRGSLGTLKVGRRRR